MNRIRKNLFIFFTIFSGVLWGIISLFLKPLVSSGLSSVQVNFLRGLFSSIFMFIFLLIKDKKLLKISLKDIWMFLGTGVLSFTFFSLCYFYTIIESGSCIAVILLYTSPIFVLLLSFFLFKEKFSMLKVLALVFTFTGCILVSGLGFNSVISWKGFAVGFCSGFGYALYSIFSRYALKKYSPFTITFYTFVFSTLSILPFCKVQNIMPLLSVKVLFLALGISFVCTCLPYIFYTIGLQGLETGKAAIFVTVEPLIACIAGIAVFGEALSFVKAAGIILILVSVVLCSLPAKVKTDDEAKTDSNNLNEKNS